MPRFTRVVLAAAAIALITAPAPAHAQKRQRDRITSEEIMGSAQRDLDLYQAIRALRPHFLEKSMEVRSFGNSNTPYTPLAVYLDGKRDVGVDILKSLRADKAEEVRFLDPDRASAEYGPAAAGGAILVKTKRDKAPEGA